MPSPESIGLREMLRTQIAPNFTPGGPVEVERQVLEAMAAQTPIPADLTIAKISAGGVPGEMLEVPGSAADQVILYLHGGAYTSGSCNTHRDIGTHLARSSGAKVLVLDYRLAPENPYPAAVEDATAAYRWLLSEGYQPANISIGGDSAGGGLTATTLLSLKGDGVQLPGSAFFLSPWTDLEGIGESTKTRADVDPWISPELLRPAARHYIGDSDPRNPLASPIYGDLRGFPTMLIHVGDDEILLDDTTRFAAKARADGVEVEVKVWDGMWHVFQFFAGAGMPEALESLKELGAFVKQHMGKTANVA